VDAAAGGELAQIAAVGVDRRDLLVAVGVPVVERDPAAVGAPVREQARSIGELDQVRAVRASAEEREPLGRGVELAVSDRPVAAGERGAGGRRGPRRGQERQCRYEECVSHGGDAMGAMRGPDRRQRGTA
jgi:hypothetical protein